MQGIYNYVPENNQLQFMVHLMLLLLLNVLHFYISTPRSRRAVPNRAVSCKGKGKAVPLQAWSGPEGSRKLRFPDFMTTAQDGGKLVSLTHRPPLPPGNTPGTHLC